MGLRAIKDIRSRLNKETWKESWRSPWRRKVNIFFFGSLRPHFGRFFSIFFEEMIQQVLGWKKDCVKRERVENFQHDRKEDRRGLEKKNLVVSFWTGALSDGARKKAGVPFTPTYYPKIRLHWSPAAVSGREALLDEKAKFLQFCHPTKLARRLGVQDSVICTWGSSSQRHTYGASDNAWESCFTVDLADGWKQTYHSRVLPLF